MKYFLIKYLTAPTPGMPKIDKYLTGMRPHHFYDLLIGHSVLSTWNSDVQFQCKKINGPPVFPVHISNTDSYLVFRNDLAGEVANRVGKSIEILPIQLISKAGKHLSSDYCILNVLGTFDCLDIEKSNVEYSEINPGSVIFVGTPILKLSKLKEVPGLFRVREKPTLILMTSELLVSLKISPLENLFLTEVDVTE